MVYMRKSFKDSLKVLEADIQHANTLNARETTHCSLIRTSEILRTPSSTTRLTSITTALNHSMRNVMHQNIPNSQEIEEFFAGTERLQQRKFVEKYRLIP